MTRVSSFGQNQALIQSMLSNQQRVFEVQKQVSTGKKADEFRGLASETNTLLSARSIKTRTETFQSTITRIKGIIDANDVQINAIAETAQNLRQDMLTAVGQEQALGFQEVLRESYNFIASALNTSIGGAFIFAGSKTDTPPVSGNDISNLIAATNASDLFQNDNAAPVAKIADNVELQFGALASDIALPIFESIKRIAEFDVNPATGPLNGELTAVQRTFLEGELALLDSAIQDAQKIQVQNGLKFQRLETIGEQHENSTVFLETFISDIEDVNIAEAISRLNNDSIALEASFRTLGTLTNLSLLNFI